MTDPGDKPMPAPATATTAPSSAAPFPATPAVPPAPTLVTPAGLVRTHIAAPLSYGQKVMIAVAMSTAAILLAIFVYATIDILVLCFAGILLAVFISAPADLLAKHTRLQRGTALALVLATLLLAIAGGAYFMGYTVYLQTQELSRTLRGASGQFIERLESWMPTPSAATQPAATETAATETAAGLSTTQPRVLIEGVATEPPAAAEPQVAATLPASTEPQAHTWVMEKLLQIRDAATDYFLSESAVKRVGGIAGGVVSSTFGIIGNIAVVFGVGLFFALNPGLYSRGVVTLFPISRRPRTAAILGEMRTQLQWWFVGQLCSMISIGLLTFIGLSILRVPMAVTLGMLAGLMNFIPNFGPILAAAPAVLVAFAPHGDQTQLNLGLAGWVIVLYIIIQLLEGWVITPFFQQRAVELPPALIIVSQVIFGLLLGPLGLVLATPILATVLVLVRMVYVEDILGDRDPA